MTVVAGAGDIVLLGPLGHPQGELVNALGAADLACANLEVPLTGVVDPQHDGIVLRGDPALIEDLRALGIDVVGLANNHAADQGWPPLHDLTRRLVDAGMEPVGASELESEAWRPRVCGGVAFMAATAVPSRAPEHIAQVDDESGLRRLKSAIVEARRETSRVALLLHGGTPHDRRATDWQRTVARAAVEAGVSVVFGSHAHVLQGVEVVDGVPVFYGLGSIVFQYRGEGWERFERDSLVAFVDLDEEGRAVSAWLESGRLDAAGGAVRSDGEHRRGVLEHVLAAGDGWGAELELADKQIGLVL